ncbi:unnamed protein product [Sphagnum jensenii]|uniref:Uncharacterized protein n=1 Tax=Sphagnum jensenii TaxID=128206 RepID=A0ABP0XNA5_9BRYO
MQWAPDAQDVILYLAGHAHHQAVESADRGQLAVGAHVDQLAAPEAVQRVQELHQHVERVECSVAVNLRDGNEVKI